VNAGSVGGQVEVHMVLSAIEHPFYLFTSNLEQPDLENRGDLALLDPVVDRIPGHMTDLGDFRGPVPWTVEN
jgi:hypothetical protein